MGTDRRLFGIYGASGCGRGVMPLARAQLSEDLQNRSYQLVFIDDAPAARTVNDHEVLTYAEFLAAPATERRVCIAIANSVNRARLASACCRDGIGFFAVRARNTVVLDACEIGEGAILCPFVTLTSNISIGAHFHANLYSYVEHDCIIGDYVTFAPGVHCNGNVVIEDHAYIGAGAVLKQGTPGKPLVIGRGAIVGMGAVVTRSVAAGTTVVGNPARILQR